MLLRSRVSCWYNLSRTLFPHNSSMMLSKLLNFSVPQFFYLEKGIVSSSRAIGGSNVLMVNCTPPSPLLAHDNVDKRLFRCFFPSLLVSELEMHFTPSFTFLFFFSFPSLFQLLFFSFLFFFHFFFFFFLTTRKEEEKGKGIFLKSYHWTLIHISQSAVSICV